MGTETVRDQTQGLLRPDERFSADTLKGKGAGSTDSVYTQAGPRPGLPVATQDTHLVLGASGSQSEDGHLMVRTMRAGHPGPSGHAGMVWRDIEGGDGTDDYKGRDSYGTVTAFKWLFGSNSGDPVLIPHVIRLQSKKLLASGIETQGVTPDHLRRYDPSTSAWTSLSVTGADTLVPNAAASTLIQLPSGRVVIYLSRTDEQVDAYYSDDEGDTWSIYSPRVLPSHCSQTIEELRAAYSGGEVVLLVGYTEGGGNRTFDQHASEDLGQSFTSVLTDFYAVDGSQASLLQAVGKPDSGFIVGYYDHSPSGQVRHLDSAYTDCTTVDEIAAHPVGSLSYSVWMDEDGTYYTTGHSSIITAGVLLSRSLDGGYTWEDWRNPVMSMGTANEYPQYASANSVGGRAFLVSHWAASATAYAQESVAVWSLGGYSRHTMPASWEATEFADTDYLTWVGDGTYGAAGWFATEEPGNLGGIWTVGGAGADTLGVNGSMYISTTAQVRHYTRTETDDPDTIEVEAGVYVDAGAGSVTTDDIAFQIIHSDASTYERDISVRIMHNKYRLWDNVAGAQIGADQPLDLTTAQQIRVAVTKGSGGVSKVKTFYAEDAHVREFQEGPGGDATDTGGPYATNCTYKWGHLWASTSLSYWSMFGYCNWTSRANERADYGPGIAWSNPTHLHTAPYPTQPALVYDGVQLQAKSGPTRIAETFTVQADYDYPIDAVFVDTHPSPRREWRSTADNTDVSLVFDLEGLFSAGRFDNSTIGAALFNSNLKTVKLQRWTGSWQDVLSINSAAGYASLKYVTDGRKIYPDESQVTQGEKYLWYHGCAGAQFDLGSGATDEDRYKLIATNTEGSWVGSGGSTKRPTLTIENGYLTGSEAVSGTGLMWLPDYAGVAHEYTEDEEIYRIFIPAQKTAEGYYRIGTLVVGEALIFGAQYDWNYSTATKHNVEVISRTDGTTYARKRGPSRREFSFAWMNTAVDETAAWATDPSPDYIAGTTSGEPIANKADTLRAIEGFLDRQDGPAGVGVLLLAVPDGSGTHQLNGRHQLILGRIMTDPTRETPLGEECSTEVGKLNELVFREEV